MGGVIRALIDDLQPVVGPENCGSPRTPAGAPAVGHRHLAARERNLIAGYSDGLEDRAPDHALGLLVEIGEIVGLRVHSAASRVTPVSAAATNSSRIFRKRPSSAWKST